MSRCDSFLAAHDRSESKPRSSSRGRTEGRRRSKFCSVLRTVLFFELLLRSLNLRNIGDSIWSKRSTPAISVSRMQSILFFCYIFRLFFNILLIIITNYRLHRYFIIIVIVVVVVNNLGTAEATTETKQSMMLKQNTKLIAIAFW